MSQKLEDVLDLNDVFTHAYIEAMFFTESGDIGLPLNDVVYSDISLEFAKQTAEDIAEFKERAGILIEEHPSQAGHDFWLTRNGHGSGFWDRKEVYGEPDYQILSRIAEDEFCQIHPYVGDDGKIYDHG